MLKFIWGFLKFIFSGWSKSISSYTKQKIASDWVKINEYLKTQNPVYLKQGLIMADKTLDNALKDLVVGNTMGERLKAAKTIFNSDTYNKIWEAHKVRNSMVHDADYEPPYYLLQSSIKNLKTGLFELGVKI